MITINDIDFRYINAEFIMTNACNLKCSYCFEYQHIAENCQIQALNFEQIAEYMDLIVQNRKDAQIPYDTPSYINFFGGEPMLQWETIFQIIKTYSPFKFFKFSIITNGLLVTEEILKESKDFPILWQISIDSSNPKGNIYRFKNNSEKYTHYILNIIQLIVTYNFPIPIVSSVITDISVDTILETYRYFASRRIPIRWQFMLERLNDHSNLLEIYTRECEQIIGELVNDPYNIPMLWENTITCFRAQRDGGRFDFPIALSDAPSPNNIYIVGQNGKIYLTTNVLNAFDSKPEYESIGDAKTGIILDKVKNHKLLEKISTNLESCTECPSFLINPCCIQRQFLAYPGQFQGNCNTFLATTCFSLEYLRRKGEI